MREQILIDFSNTKAMIALMDKYGEDPYTFSAKNENGEDIFAFITKDNICVTTYQNNNHVRKAFLYRDGTTEEVFDTKFREKAQ